MSSGDFPEWFYCFICHEEIENEHDAQFVAEEHRQAHKACLDQSEGEK